MACNAFRIGRGAGGCSVASRGRRSRSWTTSPDHWPRPRARASTPERTTRPECSASTRPATNCGSTSGHRARPVPARPLSPSACRPPAAEHRRGRAALPDYRGDDLRPNTVELRADSLINFAEFLASHNRCWSQSRRPKAPRHHHLSGQQPLTAQADQSPNRVPRFTKWAPPLGRPADRCAGKVISESFQSLSFAMMLSI
jgi:hypothetical protein